MHAEYYIRNSALRISFGDEEKSKKYTVAVDFKWIHERTNMFYTMGIDMIIVDMLGIAEYRYDRTMRQNECLLEVKLFKNRNYATKNSV